MLGPYIKSRGIRATEMSANAALITLETYVQQGETIWKPGFHTWAKMFKKKSILGYLGGPDQWSDWAYLAFQLSSHLYLCTCQIRKQSYKKFLSLNPNYEKNILFFIFGGSNPGERKFRGSKTSSQSRHMYNKGNKATRSPEISREQVQKLTPQFFLYIYWI